MKKIKTIFACCIAGTFLCACTSHMPPSTATKTPIQETKAQVSETQTQVTQTLPQPSETQPQQDLLGNETQVSEEADTLETPQAKLSKVIWGQDSFFSNGYGKQMTIDEYCSTFGAGSDVAVEITKYTFVDLDQDEIPEAVLWVTANGVTDYGTVVLRYQNESVVGYDLTYRQMIDLKKDGTFCYSGGVADTGCASLAFTEDSWGYRTIANVTEDGDTVTFMRNGEVVSETEYWQFMDDQDAKEGVAWIDYDQH